MPRYMGILFLAVVAAVFAGAAAFSSSVTPQLECALCGLAINEIEGLVEENKTSTQIIQAIEDGICSHLSGDLKALCDQVAQLTPVIVEKLIDHEKAGAICMDLKLCSGPRNDRPDPISMPKRMFPICFTASYTVPLLIVEQASSTSTSPPNSAGCCPCSPSSQRSMNFFPYLTNYFLPPLPNSMLWEPS